MACNTGACTSTVSGVSASIVATAHTECDRHLDNDASGVTIRTDVPHHVIASSLIIGHGDTVLARELV